MKDQPEYECTALDRDDKKNVVFVEVTVKVLEE
jgi:hypothetical protein